MSYTILYNINHKWLVLIISTILAVFPFECAYSLDVVFRLDDPSLTKSEFTERIVNLFAQKKVPLSIAIVACNDEEYPITPIDTSLVNKLNKGDFEICLHGMNHKQHDGVGEFSGITKTEARRRLAIAMNALDPLVPNGIRTFIPPHNAINKESITEISHYYSIVSSDMFTTAYIDGIDYYPETLGHLIGGGIWKAAREVLEAQYYDNDICVIMFHQYDLETEKDWTELTAILNYCKTHNHIKLHTFSTLQSSGNRSSWKRLKANQLESGLKKIILKEGVLYPTCICYTVHIANALLYALLPLLMMILLCIFRRSVHPLIKVLFLTITASVFIAAYLHLLGPLKLLAFLFLICLVLLFLTLRLTKANKLTE